MRGAYSFDVEDSRQKKVELGFQEESEEGIASQLVGSPHTALLDASRTRQECFEYGSESESEEKEKEEGEEDAGVVEEVRGLVLYSERRYSPRD